MANRSNWISGFLGILFLSACQWQSGQNDPLVAKVYDKQLYLSEIRQVLPEDLNSQDSMLALQAYVTRWLKENVLLHEAEKNIPSDLQIDQLTNNYRASLILNQFEKSIVENSLDTIISEEELHNYYDENKSQYQLESTIVRCYMVKIPRNLDEKILRRFENKWDSRKDQDFKDLIDLSRSYATTYFLDDSVWYKLDIISQEMPQGSINSNAIRNNQVFQLTNDQYYYFLKILEIRDKKEIAPLAFIQQQAVNVILHKRKIALLEKLKEDLYQRAVSRDDIKLF